MFEKAYVEITNICNLSCSFCHGTKRTPKRMSLEEFDLITDKLKGNAKHLYFHLMGEPLSHPLLPKFISLAKEKGFIPILTTNGTLLEKCSSSLLEAKPFKISISLQSFEGNDNKTEELETYLESVCSFSKKAAPEIVIVLRLWNLGGKESRNNEILNILHQEFPGEWRKNRSGFALSDKVFLEYGEAFEWPDENAKEIEKDHGFFCYGLRNQIGILVDGSLVPCCLDADGTIALGNIFNENLDEILNSKRAKALYDGFSMHTPTENLCKHCGYAANTMNYHGTKGSGFAK